MPEHRGDPETPDDITVVMVESRALLGIGVREVLDEATGIEVVAQVRSADDALAIVTDAPPDVILVNVPPDEASAGDAARRLHEGTPGSALVVLGGEDDDASISGALEIGADAHVSELARPQELVATIRAAAEGDHPLRDELAARPDLHERIVADVRELMRADLVASSPLSERELDVLRLVAAGMRNRGIGAHMEVSEQTVKNYLTSILHKLGVKNRTAAVMYAVRHGWLELPESVGASR